MFLYPINVKQGITEWISKLYDYFVVPGTLIIQNVASQETHVTNFLQNLKS
jgi:hypothetical protein